MRGTLGYSSIGVLLEYLTCCLVEALRHHGSGDFLPFFETAADPTLQKTLIPSFAAVAIPANEFAVEDPFAEVGKPACLDGPQPGWLAIPGA